MPTHAVASTLLPVAQIRANPDQPRKVFNAAEMELLQASLQERGLINPVSGTAGHALVFLKGYPTHDRPHADRLA